MSGKLYGVTEIYMIAVKAFRSLPRFIRGKRSGLISDRFQERLMLSVTAVNKCAMCSYAHTEMALKAGLKPDEIRMFLDEGDFPDLPEDEMKAVLFAEHYADRRGKPDKAVWKEILSHYGKDRALAILSVIRIIMMGNALGIVFGSVSSRIHGEKGDERSRPSYEIAVLLLLLPMVILAIPHALVLGIFRNNLI